MLRAVRFAITKDMKLSQDVNDAIVVLRRHISEVSVERIREELYKAFMHDTLKTIALLSELKLLEEVFDKTPLRLKPTLES